MKKVLMLLTILLWPLNILAYSDYVISGGETIGINVSTNGIMIVGFYKIDGKYNRGKPELTNNDYIIKINNQDVSSVDDMTKVIENANDKRSINITFKRGQKILNTKLPLVLSEGKYKTGLFVKSSIKGIGTLTYIDPQTHIFGALGHEIAESETNSMVEIKSGTIFESYIANIEKSYPGVAGSKVASFNEQNVYGSITKNTRYGIFGLYENDLADYVPIKVSNNVKIGKAYIKTVLENDEVKNYLIDIININEKGKTKNITLKIIDDELLAKTGGVIQGMSGSPIIQNDSIVGVLTHVIVDNPVTGYGLLITKMLEEGER